MKKNILLFLFGMLLLLGSCEKLMPGRQAIYVRNNSSRTIYYYAEYILPDTMLSVNKPRWLKEVAPGGIREFYDSEVNDKEFKRLDSGERITVFILDKTTVNTYKWEYIRENNMILKRYEFNEEERKAMGGKVIYP
jgi:hypothetical protein